MILIYLFLAVPGLHGCAWALSGCSRQGPASVCSCSKQGLSNCRVWASRYSGFSRCRAQALGRSGSVVRVCERSCSAAHGVVSDQGSNPSVPCIGRCVLNHWTTREALPLILFCLSAVGVHINFPYSPFTSKSL